MTSQRMRSGFSRRARERPTLPFSAPSGWNFSSFKIISKFRRISGSSSIIRIFFMVRFGVGKGGGLAEDGQPDGDGGSLTDRALDVDSAAVEFDAAFDDGQAQAGAGDMADVAAAVEGFEQPAEVLFGDSQPMIFNAAERVIPVALDGELDRAAFG